MLFAYLYFFPLQIHSACGAMVATATPKGTQDGIQQASGKWSSGVLACRGGVAELLVFSGRSSGVSCFNSILLYV